MSRKTIKVLLFLAGALLLVTGVALARKRSQSISPPIRCYPAGRN